MWARRLALIRVTVWLMKWWKSELHSCHKRSQNMSVWFFAPGMIHNAAFKAWKEAHALSCSLQRHERRHPAAPAVELSFCFAVWLRWADAAWHGTDFACVYFWFCTCVLAGLEVQKKGLRWSCEFLCRSWKLRCSSPLISSKTFELLCLIPLLFTAPPLPHPRHSSVALRKWQKKQVAGRSDRAARFLGRINIKRTTTTCHVLVLKGLAA